MLVSDQVDPVLLLVSVGEAMNNFGSVVLLGKNVIVGDSYFVKIWEIALIVRFRIGITPVNYFATNGKLGYVCPIFKF